MTQTESYLAIDLGAESGRVMLGAFDGHRLSLEEMHRFPNPGLRALDGLHWDVLRLFDEMKRGVRKAVAHRPVSLGVDTWGVDYALLDRDGVLVGNPYHYRDSRTNGVMARVLEIVPRKEIFRETGLQFMEINTLYQLYSMKGTAALESAATLLMMPDLFHYWFTGRKACEYSDASTTQFLNPQTRAWSTALLERLGLPSQIGGEIVEPATKLGELLPQVAEECGSGPMTVIAPASHDTGSAVAAVPTAGGDWAYLSSGTWSLMGMETQRPYVTDETLARNYTNEGGVFGTTRLLKNICGMWLLEECRREWSREGSETGYEELLASARAAPPFRSVIDVDSPSFVAPGGMPERIAAYCRATGQLSPETPGQFARVIFESLALKYRIVIDDLAAITGRRAQTLHVVGGGSRNAQLCQYTADACAVPVVAGPVEATAMGNILLQAKAMGRLAGATEIREVVRRSADLKTYEPAGSPDAWAEAAGRLSALLSS